MTTDTNSKSTGEVVSPVETEQSATIRAPPSSPIDLPTIAGTSLRVQQQEPVESTPPRGGDEAHAEQIEKPSDSEVSKDDANKAVDETQPHSPTFKEQVYGYAKLFRGTVLGRQDVKEQGAQVLRGEQGIPPRRSSK